MVPNHVTNMASLNGNIAALFGEKQTIYNAKKYAVKAALVILGGEVSDYFIELVTGRDVDSPFRPLDGEVVAIVDDCFNQMPMQTQRQLYRQFREVEIFRGTEWNRTRTFDEFIYAPDQIQVDWHENDFLFPAPLMVTIAGFNADFKLPAERLAYIGDLVEYFESDADEAGLVNIKPDYSELQFYASTLGSKWGLFDVYEARSGVMFSTAKQPLTDEGFKHFAATLQEHFSLYLTKIKFTHEDEEYWGESTLKEGVVTTFKEDLDLPETEDRITYD